MFSADKRDLKTPWPTRYSAKDLLEIKLMALEKSQRKKRLMSKKPLSTIPTKIKK